MGRKPNPLVLTHFNRGAKLENASNRYQYTCKSCGKHFPKGRMDSLVAHLTDVARKCANLDDQASFDILQTLSEQKSTRQAGDHSNVPANGNAVDATNQGLSEIGVVDEGRSLTGLEALAEASRQVERPADDESGVGGDHHHDSLIDPSLKDYEIRLHSTLAASLGYPINGMLSSAQDLSSIAASANNLEPYFPSAIGDSATNPIDVSDSFHTLEALRYSTTWTGPSTGVAEDHAATIVRAATYPRAIVSVPRDDSASGTGSDGPPKKLQRVRGKFSDTRRREVLAVRKMGACLRCKMLRKNCSGGDPCSTCAKVETARTWKTPCIRIKLGQAFELFSTCVFARSFPPHVWLNHRESERDKGGQVVISHYSVHQCFVAWDAVQLFQPVQTIDPSLHSKLILLNQSPELVIEKMDQYLEALTQSISHYDTTGRTINQTLSFIARNIHNLDDVLIPQALRLWHLTDLLTSPETRFRLWYSETPITSMPDYAKLRPIPHDESLEASQGAALLSAQWKALLEGRATKLCQLVLNELEKRLLMHKQDFQIFLVSFLFLSSVERMEWYVRSFESIEKLHQWSLAEAPDVFADRCSSFISFLCDLLKQRHIVPRTMTNPATETLTSVNPDDAIAVSWFRAVSLQEHVLKVCRDAKNDISKPQSLDKKYTAQLLLP